MITHRCWYSQLRRISAKSLASALHKESFVRADCDWTDSNSRCHFEMKFIPKCITEVVDKMGVYNSAYSHLRCLLLFPLPKRWLMFIVSTCCGLSCGHSLRWLKNVIIVFLFCHRGSKQPVHSSHAEPAALSEAELPRYVSLQLSIYLSSSCGATNTILGWNHVDGISITLW